MDREVSCNVAFLDKETFRILDEAPWGAINERLIAYAATRARRYSWSSGTADILPGGMTPEQIAADVIAKTISGERGYKAALGALDPWLRQQVKSELSNLVLSARHRQTTPLVDNESATEEMSVHFVVMATDGHPETPETIFLATDEAKNRRIRLMAAAEGDEELEDLVLTILDLDIDDVRPQHIAQILSISVRQYEARLRRLARRAAKIRAS